MIAEVQKRRKKKKKRLVLLRAHAANFDKERGAPPAPKKTDKPAQLPADDAQEAGGGDLGAWIADLQKAARIGLEEDDDAPSGGDATEVASALDTADMIEALAADQGALPGPKRRGGTRNRLARFGESIPFETPLERGRRTRVPMREHARGADTGLEEEKGRAGLWRPFRGHIRGGVPGLRCKAAAGE